MMWCPTLLLWATLSIVVGMVLIAWLFWGESFLSATRRVPAECLVVEGWIGLDGVRAAALSRLRRVVVPTRYPETESGTARRYRNAAGESCVKEPRNRYFRLFAWRKGSQAPFCLLLATHCVMKSIPSTPS